ncbi:hypothetical protein KCU73_g180, partial [Aureobasidium melanogenum]
MVLRQADAGRLMSEFAFINLRDCCRHNLVGSNGSSYLSKQLWIRLNLPALFGVCDLLVILTVAAGILPRMLFYPSAKRQLQKSR